MEVRWFGGGENDEKMNGLMEVVDELCSYSNRTTIWNVHRAVCYLLNGKLNPVRKPHLFQFAVTLTETIPLKWYVVLVMVPMIMVWKCSNINACVRAWRVCMMFEKIPACKNYIWWLCEINTFYRVNVKCSFRFFQKWHGKIQKPSYHSMKSFIQTKSRLKY